MAATTGAGNLTSRVSFSERIFINDALGNRQAQWVERLSGEPAQITVARGGEALDARRLEGRLTVTLRVRAHSGTRKITPDWMARDTRTGVSYAIKTAFDPGMGGPEHDKWLDLDAEAGGAVG